MLVFIVNSPFQTYILEDNSSGIVRSVAVECRGNVPYSVMLGFIVDSLFQTVSISDWAEIPAAQQLRSKSMTAGLEIATSPVLFSTFTGE
jgi:hypothetical protein